MEKQLIIVASPDGQRLGYDPETGDVYAPNTGMGALQIGQFFSNIFKGGGKAASTGLTTTQNTIGNAALNVGKNPTVWNKIGNVAGQAAQGVFNPNTAAGGLTQALVNNWASNIAASGQYYGGYPPGYVPPQQNQPIDTKTLLMIGGGLAAVLILVIALK